MSSQQKVNKAEELEQFLQAFELYLNYLTRHLTKKLTSEQTIEFGQLRVALVEDVGRFRGLIAELTGKEKVIIEAKREGLPREESSVDMWLTALKILYDPLRVNALVHCIDVTRMAIGKLKLEIEQGIRDEQGNRIEEPPRIVAASPKAFVVHGGETPARDKLQRFLIALGVQPLIIEEAPKEGRSVNQQVEHYSKMADCAILLGTADDKELKDGKLYPRRNDFIEIGRFLEKSPRRIVYLQEEGASFPSIIAEKLRTPFTQENMDEAFIALTRELRAFGMLKAVKPINET